jgi:hypothetical protein
VSGSSFCREEYPYYDGISPNPNRIEPVDVVVTVAMNSFLSADGIRRVHRWMSENCEDILASIPLDINLRDVTPDQLEVLRALLEAAREGSVSLWRWPRRCCIEGGQASSQ